MRSHRAPTVAAITVAVLAAVAGEVAAVWATQANHQSLVTGGLDAAVVLAFALVGAVVAAARPANVIGWLMLVGGMFWSLGSAGTTLGYRGIVAAPGSVAGASAWTVVGAAALSVGWYLVTTAVPVVFPDGHVLGRRWRWLVKASIVVVIAGIIDPLTDTQADRTDFGAWRNPIALHGAGRIVSAIAFLGHIPLSIIVTLAAVVQLIRRWQRGDALERQQIGMFAAAAALPVIAAPIAFAAGGIGWIFDLTALPLPFAIGFAVLARGLYDLRTATNRTLVWLTMSAVVTAVFALVIVGLADMMNADRRSTWVLAIGAGIVAVLFAPLRDGLQRAVNRLTFGRWDQPYDVLAELGQRVVGAAEAERLLSDVAAELESSLGLRSVSIADAAGTLLTGEPRSGADGAEAVIPLTAYGEPVGTLRYRPPVTPLRGRDRRLLDDLAGHLGGVLHAHRLTGDLERARERLVLAREEERRRLRRDLHDGLGPALAGHLLRLDLLAARVAWDQSATADLDNLRADLRETMTEVRRLVEGLRPPALDELGLVGSLVQVTDRLTKGTRTRLTLSAADLPPLSAAVEVASFRIVTEAVTNVVKHADASRCSVDLAAGGGRLRIVVTDDGSGIQTAGSTWAGNGLQTMRERAEELRGRLVVTSGGNGVGTTVCADLPLPPQQRSRARRTQLTASPR